MDDETPRISDQRAETLLGDMIVAIFKMLGAIEGSDSHSQIVRELRARAEGYEQTVARWATTAPSATERNETFDLVVELHTKVVAVKGHAPAPAGARPRKGSERE
jgi:hypothetical protein